MRTVPRLSETQPDTVESHLLSFSSLADHSKRLSQGTTVLVVSTRVYYHVRDSKPGLHGSLRLGTHSRGNPEGTGRALASCGQSLEGGRCHPHKRCL
jgi:hypothetical protein